MAKYRVQLRIDKVTGDQRTPAEHADMHLGEFTFDSMADLQARVEEFRAQCFGVRPVPATEGSHEDTHADGTGKTA